MLSGPARPWNLPGADVVDPRLERLERQVICPDIDGQEDVPCEGPIRVEQIHLAHKVAPAVHQHILRQGVELFEARLPDAWYGADFDFVGTSDFARRMLLAVDDEDLQAAPWGGDYYGSILAPFREHFYDPDEPDASDHLDEIWGIDINPDDESALDRAELYWPGYVLGNYRAGRAADSWYYLGRVAHLVADMTVPAHVHLDPHGNINDIGLLVGDDNYEDYMAEFDDDYPLHFNYEQWHAADVAGPIPAYGSLAGVFYQVAEITDDYDSDDVDGEFSGEDDINWGEVEYSKCKIYGDSLMPLAFQGTAALLKLFVDFVQPTVALAAPHRPTQSVTLLADPTTAGTMPVRQVEFQYSIDPADPQAWVALSTDASPAGGWSATQDLDWLDYGQSAYYRARACDQGGLYSEWARTGVVRNRPPVADAGGPYETEQGNDLLLDASASFDPDGQVVLYQWDLDGGGQYDDAVGPTAVVAAADPGEFTVGLRVTDNDGAWGDGSALVRVHPLAQAEVLARYVFYNNSAFDDPARSLGDDDAVAPDPDHAAEPRLGKTPLLPGQTATFRNYTSYEKGLNGIMVDVADLAGAVTAESFEFKRGNDSRPGDWQPAPAPASVSVRPGAGVGESSRVTVTWEDYAIRNTWLEVRLKGEEFGLDEDEVFYFGNAPGEAGDGSADAIVNTADEILARTCPRGPRNPAPIDAPCDFNRDRLVDVSDRIIARTSRTGAATALKLITVPLPGGGAAGNNTAPAHDAVLRRQARRPSAAEASWPGKLAWLMDVDSLRPRRAQKRGSPAQQAVRRAVASLRA